MGVYDASVYPWYVCVSMCMEVRAQCQASALSLTIILRQGLSLSLELTDWLDLLASEFWR